MLKAVRLCAADRRPRLPQVHLIQTAICRLVRADILADHRRISAHGGDRVPPSPAMVPGRVLAAPHKGPSNVDRRFPLEKAHHLRHRVLRRNGEEHVHVIRHQVPLFNPTFLLRSQRPEDLPEMPPQLMVECFPTILRDKHHMILAVPRGMIQSLDVWHDRLPLRETLSGSREGVCCFDSRSCQTLGVPRQSRGVTLGNYCLRSGNPTPICMPLTPKSPRSSRG